VADKIAVIDRFLEVADVLIIGGAMCFPFLCALGHAVGDSLCDEEDTEHARHALAKAQGPGRREWSCERSRDRRPPRGRRAASRARRG